MLERKKRKMGLGGAMLASGALSLVAARIVNREELRWVFMGLALCLLGLAVVMFVSAAGEPQ